MPINVTNKTITTPNPQATALRDVVLAARVEAVRWEFDVVTVLSAGRVNQLP